MKLSMDANDVKAALRRRHPATQTRNGLVTLDGWTVLEEYLGIDLLAICAYENPRKGARTEKVEGWGGREDRRTIARYPIVGYEVKVSRSDYRRELLNPVKRADARLSCHEFYFATPRGLLKPAEVAFVEPPVLSFPEAFADVPCPNYCYQGKDYPRRPDGSKDYRAELIVCPACSGRGISDESHAKRLAPTLWVPADVGLVEVDGRGARVVKPSPVLREPPQPLNHQGLGALIRYASLKPDPRHAAVRDSDARRKELARR